MSISEVTKNWYKIAGHSRKAVFPRVCTHNSRHDANDGVICTFSTNHNCSRETTHKISKRMNARLMMSCGSYWTSLYRLSSVAKSLLQKSPQLCSQIVVYESRVVLCGVVSWENFHNNAWSAESLLHFIVLWKNSLWVAHLITLKNWQWCFC